MEPSIASSLSGLAEIAAKKWFALMGLFGLILFFTALVAPLPTDRITVICIALIMMGVGFGHADCRTFQQHVGRGYILTGPVFKATPTGIALYLLASAGAIGLAVRLFTLGTIAA